MRCPIRLLLCLILTPLALCAEDALEDALQAYVGRWEGEFTLHSTATAYTEVFPVEQLYWMEDGVLHGLAVSDRESGLQTARSETQVEGEQLVSVVYHDSSEERYIGSLHEGGVVWLPADVRRVTDYQMKEHIAEVEGVRTLKTEGFDTFIYKDGLAHIVFRGELRLSPEAQ